MARQPRGTYHDKPRRDLEHRQVRSENNSRQPFWLASNPPEPRKHDDVRAAYGNFVDRLRLCDRPVLRTFATDARSLARLFSGHVTVFGAGADWVRNRDADYCDLAIPLGDSLPLERIVRRDRWSDGRSVAIAADRCRHPAHRHWIVCVFRCSVSPRLAPITWNCDPCCRTRRDRAAAVHSQTQAPWFASVASSAMRRSSAQTKTTFRLPGICASVVSPFFRNCTSRSRLLEWLPLAAFESLRKIDIRCSVLSRSIEAFWRTTWSGAPSSGAAISIRSRSTPLGMMPAIGGHLASDIIASLPCKSARKFARKCPIDPSSPRLFSL